MCTHSRDRAAIRASVGRKTLSERASERRELFERIRSKTNQSIDVLVFFFFFFFFFKPNATNGAVRKRSEEESTRPTRFRDERDLATSFFATKRKAKARALWLKGIIESALRREKEGKKKEEKKIEKKSGKSKRKWKRKSVHTKFVVTQNMDDDKQNKRIQTQTLLLRAKRR